MIVGISPTVDARRVFDTATASGRLVHRFLQSVPGDIEVALWNIAPELSFLRGGLDLPYHVAFEEEPQVLEKLHSLNLELITNAAKHFHA